MNSSQDVTKLVPPSATKGAVLCVRPAPFVLMDSDKPTAPEKLREEVARAKEHGDSTMEQPIIAVFSAREYEEAERRRRGRF